jgi:hypothetical protein
MWEETTVELVMDDPWYPDTEYTNEDDFCSMLVHGWELEWYWDNDGWSPADGGNTVDIWFSRSTGEASFCLSVDDADCRGPDASDIVAPFCIDYWLKCDSKPVSVASTVDDDLVADAWSSWFGW